MAETPGEKMTREHMARNLIYWLFNAYSGMIIAICPLEPLRRDVDSISTSTNGLKKQYALNVQVSGWITSLQ